MNELGPILFMLLFFAAGLALVVGARRRVSWLINPPDELWTCYSQAFIKKVKKPVNSHVMLPEELK